MKLEKYQLKKPAGEKDLFGVYNKLMKHSKQELMKRMKQELMKPLKYDVIKPNGRFFLCFSYVWAV